MISSTIHLVQMETSVTRTSRNYFLDNPPLIKPQTKKQFTNRKVHPIIMCMDFIFPLIWMLGIKFSMDEITMIFKGHHVEKIRMTYKS